MTQWRGVMPLRTKQYGMVGPMNMLGYSSPGLDMNELRNRGWTAKLIEKYLGNEDRRDSVAHWANFTGKKVYYIARVEKAEAMAEFEVDFIQSAKRRKLPQEFVDTTLQRCRALRDGNRT